LKQYIGVFSSDSIDRTGSRLTPGALISGLWGATEIGLPADISHDALRIVGWARPFAVHFESTLTRLVGCMWEAETPEDVEELTGRLIYYEQKRIKGYTGDFDRLRRILGVSLLGREEMLVAECVTLVEPSLARRACPQLFAMADSDKDNLVPLSKLSPIGPGVFRVGDLAVFAHPYFRRSLFRANSLNEAFLQQLATLDPAQQTVKIALDRDMVGLVSTYQEEVEYEYWYGPKFSDDLTMIPLGVSCHQASDVERFFHGMSATEFWWQSRDDLHILEVEELRDRPSGGVASDRYGCLYVHSIVEECSGRIQHFDGSIRTYSEEHMLARLETNIMHSGRNTEYTKLWRVDGSISVADWKALLTHYYRDNHLVGEYLGVPQDEETPDAIEDIGSPTTAVEEYVPYSLQGHRGVRIAFSSHPPAGQVHSKPTLISLNTARIGEEQHQVLDAKGVELTKALMRAGLAPAVEGDVIYLLWNDGYVELPFVFLPEHDLATNLDKLMSALKAVVGGFQKKGADLVISCSFGFPLQGLEIRIAVVGTLANLAAWLESPLAIPSLTPDELETWADGVADWLGQYPAVGDVPRLRDALMTSGLMPFLRKKISPDLYSFKRSPGDGALMYELAVPRSDRVLFDALQQGRIWPAVGYQLTESRCSNCGSEYQTCPCSAILDENVTQELGLPGAVFLFLTDRRFQPRRLDE